MTCSNKKIQRNDRDEKMHWTTSSACPKKVPKIVDLAAILFMLIDGQDLKIQLGNRASRIQHTLIMLKSQVPNFY